MRYLLRFVEEILEGLSLIKLYPSIQKIQKPLKN